ncbi:ribonuclease H-like YkuK family protein [Paenibacillus sp. FSL H8-0034]|uniref:ribonuclease H-like YkuK family protein n=1 Tax=Paenibacillus sp. FSL H8-0034 TaxID=2954671 RepID=UPI0030F5E780
MNNQDDVLTHSLTFRNTSEQGLSLKQVHERIIDFIQLDPKAAYKFIIGTDCQVHQGYTQFITGVVIQRPGNGAWACYRQVIIPRAIASIKEKLSTETALSEEIALYFSDEKRRQMEDIVLPFVYKGASFESYIHIDAGSDHVKNKTSLYVAEMVLRVQSLGMVPIIKPDSYVASAYANRYSKKKHQIII